MGRTPTSREAVAVAVLLRDSLVLRDAATAVSLERLAGYAPWDDAVVTGPSHEVGGEGG